MKDRLTSATYAAGIALGGLLHPASADMAHAQTHTDKTCTLFNGDVLSQGEVLNGYQCIGSVIGKNETVIDIIRVHKTFDERGLYFIERDKDGYERSRDFMQLAYPDYTLPAQIKVHDYLGDTYTVPLTNGLYMYEPTPTPTREPTATPQPTAETEIIYADPLPTTSHVATVEQSHEHPTVQEQPQQKPADVPTTEPEIPQCLNSWGKEVPLGLDVPGSDDCISISPNSPNAGDTTYTFQSEPDSSGNKSIVEVVYDADGTVYLKMQKRNSHIATQPVAVQKQEDSDTLTSFMEKAKIAFGKLRSLFSTTITEPVVTHHEPTQHEALALHTSYPTLEELPQNVLYPQTYQWYNTIVPIAQDLSYDPRTHLVFIQIESSGINGLTSSADAQGLVQIVPETWKDILNTIKKNPELLAAAAENGLNPQTMDINDPKANIFASAVYLTVYCRFPLGPIPTSTDELNEYVEKVALAGIYYHDGPSSDPSKTISPHGVEYREKIRRLLPQMAK